MLRAMSGESPRAELLGGFTSTVDLELSLLHLRHDRF